MYEYADAILVGSDVVALKVGDRVTSVNHSSGYAQYSIGPEFTTAIIPSNISFEGKLESVCPATKLTFTLEAATIPLSYITACLALFRNTPSPTPWNPAKTGDHNALLIYGASSAFGTYVARLAALSNIHPIIAIAGKSAADTVGKFLHPLKGDVVVDYHDGPDSMLDQIRKASGDKGIKFAIDIIGEENTTTKLIAEVLNPEESYYAFGVPLTYTPRLPKGTSWKQVFGPGLWEPEDDDGPDGKGSSATSLQAFATVAFRYLTFAMTKGLIGGHPWKVMTSGLGSLEEALREHKAGQHGSLKQIFRVEETDWSKGQIGD